MQDGGNTGPGLAGKVFISALTAIALLAVLTGSAAAATTGGAPTPGGSPTAKGSPTGPSSAEPSAGTLTITAAQTSPRKSFYFGFRYPRLSFTIESSQPQNDLRIDVLDSAGEVVQTFYRNDVAPGAPTSIRWDGTTAAGKPARNGRYSFRIGPQTAAPAARPASSSTALSLSFAFYGYAFPILGPHEFDLGAGRFGAPRAGHTHQGQDVMAECGTPLVAARGGTVQYAGFEANAGNYLVIDGKGTPTTSCTPTWPNPRRCTPAKASAPASRSASSATPATPPPATSTSRCGARPAGTRAAAPSTRSPISKSGTPTADRRLGGGASLAAMCMQCMASAMTAGAAATGMRAWIATHQPQLDDRAPPETHHRRDPHRRRPGSRAATWRRNGPAPEAAKAATVASAGQR